MSTRTDFNDRMSKDQTPFLSDSNTKASQEINYAQENTKMQQEAPTHLHHQGSVHQQILQAFSSAMNPQPGQLQLWR